MLASGILRRPGGGLTGAGVFGCALACREPLMFPPVVA